MAARRKQTPVFKRAHYIFSEEVSWIRCRLQFAEALEYLEGAKSRPVFPWAKAASPARERQFSGRGERGRGEGLLG